MVSELIHNHSTVNYAVLGNPIQHSKSPQIHTLFSEQTGIALEYQAIEVPINEFASYVKLFSSQGGKGLNITVPFKEDAYSLCTTLTDRAELSGSVNTLRFDNGMNIYGDTTDGQGLLNDLVANHNIRLEDKSILILGAGGTVKSILERLLEQKTKEIVIVNRTISRAKDLEKKFSKKNCVRAYSYNDLPNHSFDIIINGTSLSLSAEIPPISKTNINKNTFCYDLMYSDKETVFTRWVIENGALKATDGLGMLVEQAAESFMFWHGTKPDTMPVIKALRDSNARL